MEFVDNSSKETALGQIEHSFEELWLNIKLWEWLKNDDELLKYAKLYLDSDEKKSLWTSIAMQAMELKLSITYSYFEEFKDFLEELKKWENTPEESDEDDVEINYAESDFMWTDIKEIESQPFYRNSATWVTRCAATARFNSQDFWLDLPTWNAYDAGKLPWSECLETIPNSKKEERPNNNWNPIDVKDFLNLDDNVNFADLYTWSSSTYGHRVVAFKDSNWKRYVLDPYTRVNWKLDNSPKPITDYIEERKLVKAHFYHSEWYQRETRNYA